MISPTFTARNNNAYNSMTTPNTASGTTRAGDILAVYAGTAGFKVGGLIRSGLLDYVANAII